MARADGSIVFPHTSTALCGKKRDDPTGADDTDHQCLWLADLFGGVDSTLRGVSSKKYKTQA